MNLLLHVFNDAHPLADALQCECIFTREHPSTNAYARCCSSSSLISCCVSCCHRVGQLSGTKTCRPWRQQSCCCCTTFDSIGDSLSEIKKYVRTTGRMTRNHLSSSIRSCWTFKIIRPIDGHARGRGGTNVRDNFRVLFATLTGSTDVSCVVLIGSRRQREKDNNIYGAYHGCATRQQHDHVWWNRGGDFSLLLKSDTATDWIEGGGCR